MLRPDGGMFLDGEKQTVTPAAAGRQTILFSKFFLARHVSWCGGLLVRTLTSLAGAV